MTTINFRARRPVQLTSIIICVNLVKIDFAQIAIREQTHKLISSYLQIEHVKLQRAKWSHGKSHILNEIESVFFVRC